MKNKLNSALYLFLCALFFSSCVATSGIDNTSTISSSEGVLSKKSTYAWYQPHRLLSRLMDRALMRICTSTCCSR
ncbi:hypothetical protein [Pontibacter sp. BAB1700]|uniref:hypothetical protein n=1 Tax=Pontibacter sp. BAB1700 TaxID=1144253 RepID=UPI0012DE2327|nr:hypothetical protein [Pontibacter sp. BAB1700]